MREIGAQFVQKDAGIFARMYSEAINKTVSTGMCLVRVKVRVECVLKQKGLLFKLKVHLLFV